jgi:AraC-like DNA-binding protein
MMPSEPLNNSLNSDEMRGRLELLIEGFNSFRNEFGMSLHVKDFSGYMVSHPLLGEFTESYLFHENEFCSYIKGNSQAREKCVITSNELLRRKICEVRNNIKKTSRQYSTHRLGCGFYGVCWCGIREYVYPVCHNGIVIGALLAGAFRTEEKRLDHLFDRLQAGYGHDMLSLRKRYDAVTAPSPDEGQAFEMRVALLAEYLSMLAEHYIEYALVAAYSEACNGKTHRHKIINLAIDYISKNLSSKISVSDMSTYCMCSKSTLNHLFSAAMGRSIPEFVSIQRVNRSKYLLVNTDFSIEQIGVQCGFMSAAYFSVVFKKITGITPTEYRNHMKVRSIEDISGII